MVGQKELLRRYQYSPDIGAIAPLRLITFDLKGFEMATNTFVFYQESPIVKSEHGNIGRPSVHPTWSLAINPRGCLRPVQPETTPNEVCSRTLRGELVRNENIDLDFVGSKSGLAVSDGERRGDIGHASKSSRRAPNNAARPSLARYGHCRAGDCHSGGALGSAASDLESDAFGKPATRPGELARGTHQASSRRSSPTITPKARTARSILSGSGTPQLRDSRRAPHAICLAIPSLSA